jgi:hypothetical protein
VCAVTELTPPLKPGNPSGGKGPQSGLVEFLANRFDFLIGIAVLEAERGRQSATCLRVYAFPRRSHHVRQAAAVLHCDEDLGVSRTL